MTTRAAIAWSTVQGDSIVVDGTWNVNDGGQGALYVRSAGPGLLGIQDATGAWFNLSLGNGPVKATWFGTLIPGRVGAAGNNQAVLQSAIDAVRGRGPDGWSLGSIELPAGLYQHYGLNLTSGIALFGQGSGTTVLETPPGVTRPNIIIEPTWDVQDYVAVGGPPATIEISKLRLQSESKGDTTPGSEYCHGISFQRAASNSIYTRVVISDVVIFATPGTGIHAENFNGWANISDCLVTNVRGHALRLANVYDWRIRDTDLYGNRCCLRVEGGVGGLVMEGCNLYGAGLDHCINITGFNLGRCKFIGCSIDSNNLNGLAYDERGTSVADPNNLPPRWSFVDCYFGNQSRAQTGAYSDVMIYATARGALLLRDCQFDPPNSLYSTFNCKHNIEFQVPGLGQTIAAPGCYFAGRPITTPGITNAASQITV